MQRTALKTATLLVGLLAALPWASTTLASSALDIPAIVNRLVTEPRIEDVALSPDARHVALQIRQENKTIIVVLKRSDGKIAAHMGLGEDNHLVDPVWASDTMLLARLLLRVDKNEAQLGTGIVYRLDVSSGEAAALNSQSSGLLRGTGTRQVYAYLLDALANDDKNVLLGMETTDGLQSFPEVFRTELATARVSLVARSPVANAGFVTDGDGRVRVAQGSPENEVFETWYRENDESEWRMLHRADAKGLAWIALGFSEDGRRILFEREQDKGPNRLDWWSPDSGEWAEAWSDPVFDVGHVFRAPNGAVIGVEPAGGQGKAVFFDPASAAAAVHADLSTVLPGKRIRVGRAQGIEGVHLLFSSSDRDPGTFHIWHPGSRKLERMAAMLDGVDARELASALPISFTARDGLPLHGFLTRPVGKPTGVVPLVLMPHGGPIGVRDEGSFDESVQLLAAAGYGVLQVNFRGSSGRGAAFMDAGFGEWGGAMQRDLEDAVAWAIAEGHAEKGRLCAVGASYGAFASMLAIANDPDTFACGVGEVGLYDLSTWEESADVGRFRRAQEYVGRSIGNVDRAAISPIGRVGKIKDPVLLTAGALDQRTPARQSTAVADALRKAGVDVELKIYEGEGHGFQALENRRDRATRLLRFITKHLPPSP